MSRKVKTLLKLRSAAKSNLQRNAYSTLNATHKASSENISNAIIDNKYNAECENNYDSSYDNMVCQYCKNVSANGTSKQSTQ